MDKDRVDGAVPSSLSAFPLPLSQKTLSPVNMAVGITFQSPSRLSKETNQRLMYCKHRKPYRYCRPGTQLVYILHFATVLTEDCSVCDVQ